MTILCIEGPSAAGKTTLARALVQRIGAVAVPEVNQLFQRRPDEAPGWYLERQLDRWRLACEADAAGKVAVLDGDVLQPLWYGWTYGFPQPHPLPDLLAFYRPLMASGDLGMPHAYVVLECPADELLRRRQADPTRSRRNFERHLQLVGPQSAYFMGMEQACPGLVHRFASTAPALRGGSLEALIGKGPRVERPAATAILDALATLLQRPPQEAAVAPLQNGTGMALRFPSGESHRPRIKGLP